MAEAQVTTINRKQPIFATERALATIVLNAVAMREGSYNKDAADAESEKHRLHEEAWRADHPGQVYPFGGVDYIKFYEINLQEACERAALEQGMIGLGRLVYLALDGWWNDTIYWAQQVLDPTATISVNSEFCPHGIEYDDGSDEEFKCELCDTVAKRVGIPFPGAAA